MKKIILSVTLLVICLSLATAQQPKKRQYEAKLNEFIGKIDIEFYSEDIIGYSLVICNESGTAIFKQDGFAIFPNRKEAIQLGEEAIERTENDFVKAEQYFELCNCKKWFNIRVAEDFSIVRIDCPENFINEIFGKEVNSSVSKESFGNFILKK